MIQVPVNYRSSPGSDGSNIEGPKDKKDGGRRTRPRMIEMGKNKD